MDYSKTVNLPKTDFPMKGNLPQKEPVIQKTWEDKQIYQKLLTRPAPKGAYILHDGPPYSNGDIHIGHALNKILKDFVIKYMAMNGHTAPYVPGWDNHGMPIENKVGEQFRKKNIHPTKLEMRHECRKYARKWVDTQKEQFKRLGILGDWEDPYLTMSKGYESTIIKVFGELAEQGYIYRGLKPIHWCINDETALAEAEIEYADHKSFSIHVRFPLISDPNGYFKGKSPEHCYTIIWTTTPWTIPANLAVAIHPDEDYVLVDVGEDRYLIGKELLQATMDAMGARDFTVVKSIRGSKLEDLTFKHPLFDRKSIIVHADYVTTEDGTGVVHTAPGHGREDFETGRRYGLTPLCPVDEKGYFTKDAGQFEGLHILRQGNKAVIDALAESGNLLASGEISHSYPHCWRCHNPLIFRTTVQWFMNLDHEDLRHKILDAIENVQFYPPEAKNRLTAMIENSPDWCLSRQRSWGVGIPVFYCRDCNEAIMTKESIDAVYQDSEANGADSWYEKTPEQILPDGFTCPACGGKTFTSEEDVLDVWFDSGSSSRAVVEKRPHHSYPADTYCEGSDQHRGWFNKSLIVGMATKGIPPFKEIISHGFVLDSEGKAMSKSIGNTIAPQNIIQQIGVDVLRLFISSTDYSEDVRIGDEILKRVTESYRRIRNTFRFMLANLSDFDPAVDRVAFEDMERLDRYALHKLEDLVANVIPAYDAYEFHKVYRLVYSFCSQELSSLYLDILKDRLYASAPKSALRRSAQTVLYEVTSVLARLIAPIIPHTAEEVWQYIPGEKAESVLLAHFPFVRPDYTDKGTAERGDKILEVREQVLLALEEARQSGKIGKPMESRVVLHVPATEFEFLKEFEELLPSVFIVSQVELVDAGDDPLSVEVVAPNGVKCERCWLILESVGSHEDHPGLCDRCHEVVKDIAE